MNHLIYDMTYGKKPPKLDSNTSNNNIQKVYWMEFEGEKSTMQKNLKKGEKRNSRWNISIKSEKSLKICRKKYKYLGILDRNKLRKKKQEKSTSEGPENFSKPSRNLI